MSVVDPLQLEVLRNRFQAVVDEMAQVIARTAHTVFVKETQDFGAALVSRDGEVFAAPRRTGVLMMVGMPMASAIREVEDDLREGDVFITNDVESTGGMVTHLSDVFIWKPVFHDGTLLCWVWSFIHASDVGGSVPGSIAPSNVDLYQEGIRVPPQRLIRDGELDRAFVRLFLSNTRIPEQSWGDLQALLAGLRTAESRILELVDRYGRDTVEGSVGGVIDYAERQARAVIAHVPDGTYEYADYVEADTVGLGLIRIKLRMVIEGDRMLLDFTGTDPQVRAALNLPTHGRRGHWQLITGLVNWLCTQEPDIAYNAGLVRPLEVRMPAGTVLSPEPGAAVGGRYATAHKAFDVTIGALAQAVPDEVPAFDSGQAAILVVAVPDAEKGTTRVEVVQPAVGGSGGRPGLDGVDGAMVLTNFLKNVPTETVEADLPSILIRRYGLRPDSGGPGEFRGGVGVVIEMQTFAPFTTVTCRNMERYVFQPPGRLGGMPGASGLTLVNPGTRQERSIGKIDVLHLAPGDVLRLETPGGGGLGDPLRRPAEAVARDVRDGLVSAAAARGDYGVVLDGDGSVDGEATAALRGGMGAERPQRPPVFSFGEARDAHMRRWPVALEDALNEAVWDLSVPLRQFFHAALRGEVERRLDQGEEVAPDRLPGLLEELRRTRLSGRPILEPTPQTEEVIT